MDFLFKFTDSLIIISARKKTKDQRGLARSNYLAIFFFSNGSKGRWKSRTEGGAQISYSVPSSGLNVLCLLVGLGGCLGGDSALPLEGGPWEWRLGGVGGRGWQ